MGIINNTVALYINTVLRHYNMYITMKRIVSVSLNEESLEVPYRFLRANKTGVTSCALLGCPIQGQTRHHPPKAFVICG